MRRTRWGLVIFILNTQKGGNVNNVTSFMAIYISLFFNYIIIINYIILLYIYFWDLEYM